MTPKFNAAFWKWFGKSHVVDSKGSPLVVFHGTYEDFFRFDPKKSEHFGFHFGTYDQALARCRSAVSERIEQPDPGVDPNILAVYLSIQNPLRMTDIGDWRNSYNLWTHLDKATHGILGPYDTLKMNRIPVGRRHAKVMRALEELGYDGIVYKNRIEGRGESWIAFHPEQIKSAAANDGTWDIADPDIGSNPYDADGKKIRCSRCQKWVDESDIYCLPYEYMEKEYGERDGIYANNICGHDVGICEKCSSDPKLKQWIREKVAEWCGEDIEGSDVGSNQPVQPDLPTPPSRQFLEHTCGLMGEPGIDYVLSYDPAFPLSETGSDAAFFDSENKCGEYDGMIEDWAKHPEQEPVVLCADGHILDGWHRLGLADKLGWETIPAWVVRRGPAGAKSKIEGICSEYGNNPPALNRRTWGLVVRDATERLRADPRRKDPDACERAVNAALDATGIEIGGLSTGQIEGLWADVLLSAEAIDDLIRRG